MKLSFEFSGVANLLAFAVLYASFTWLLWLLARRKATHWGAGLAIVVIAAALLFWAVVAGIDEDESELLQATWMYAQGLRPYVDFWQHHFPLAWAVLAPVLLMLDPSPSIYLVTRLIAAALSLAIGWLAWCVAKRVWGDDFSPTSFLVVFLAGAGYWQFVWLRADLFMMAAMLAALLCVARMTEGGARYAFFAGFLTVLALSFTPKQYPTVLLPAIVILLDHSHGRDRFRRLALYAAGGVVGAMPLLALLLHAGVLRQFLHWTLEFNSGKAVVWSEFPLGPGIAAAAGICLLLQRGRVAALGGGPAALLIAFALATLASLQTIRQPFEYYMNYWFVLASILAAGINLPRLLEDGPNRSWRTAVAGLTLTLLVSHDVRRAQEHSSKWLWRDLRAMHTFLRIAGDGSVLMFNPEHPIFVPNATRLYTRWQFRFVRGPQDRELVEPEAGPSFVESIVANRPAIISRDGGTQGFLAVLKIRDLIGEEEFDRLEAFLDEQYTPAEINGQRYYVINDRVQLLR